MNFARRLAASAALVAIAVGLPALPAAAHTGFESSDPPDGSVVTAELDNIVLSFSGRAEPAGDGFVILDPTGVTRTPDTLTAGPEQKVWTLGFDPPLTGGSIGVRWTVQAPDAHPIEGGFSFTIDAPVPVEEPDDDPTEVAAGPPASTVDEGNAAGGSTSPTSKEPREPASAEESVADAVPATDQDLEAFLTETETEVANAESVGAFGRILGFVGTMLGIGGLVFAMAVLRGHRGDTLAVLKLVRYSAVLVFVGTAIDFMAHLAVVGEGWSTIWAAVAGESVALSSYGVAVGLRSAAALMLFLAATAKSVAFTGRPPALVQPRSMASIGAGAPIRADIGEAMMVDTGWPNRPRDLGPATPLPPRDQAPAALSISPAVVFSITALLVSFTFDGHTVSEGQRWITGAVDMVHVVAGAIWAGGVLALAIVLWRRSRRGARLDALELAVRFSVIAGAALAAAGVAGTVLAVIILDSVSELWTTPWGLLLIGKFTAVAATAALGTFNHFVVIPWMEADPGDDSRSLLLRTTATAEASLLCVVLIVTAFLVRAAS